MKKITSFAAILGIAVSLGACQSTTERVADKENLLAAAGFTAQPANTPDRVASMKKLPPNKFVRQARGTDFVYLYADPIVCQCVYLGDQAAYGQYRQMVFQKRLADERQMTASMNQDAFDFGPWGPWGTVVVY